MSNKYSYKYEKYFNKYHNLMVAGSGLDLDYENKNLDYYLNHVDDNETFYEIAGTKSGNILTILNRGDPGDCRAILLKTADFDDRFKGKTIWHTHPIITYPIPSAQDIMRVLWDANYSISYVYTFLGTYKIEYNGSISADGDKGYRKLYSLLDEHPKNGILMKLGYVSYNNGGWRQDEFPCKEFNQKLINIANGDKPNKVLDAIEEYIAHINSILINIGQDILSFQLGQPASTRLDKDTIELI